MVRSRPGVRFSPSALMRILFIVLLAVVILLGLGSVVVFFSNSQEPKISPTPLVFQENSGGGDLSIVVEDTNEETPRRGLLTCQRGRCLTKPFSGDTYFYRDDSLIRKTASQEQIIVAKNKLVAPRGLFVSPDGNKVAYFLDNIHDTKKELTELWVYDSGLSGTKLLVENIVRPDVLTSPRWNSAGTHLWFVADNGVKDEEKIELVVVGVAPPQAAARFSHIRWQDFKDIAERGAMDVAADGKTLVFSQAYSPFRSTLTVAEEGGLPQAVTLQGQVVFVQWSSDGDLLYTIPDKNGKGLTVLALDLGAASSREVASVVLFNENSRIVAVQDQKSKEAVAGISSVLEDAELTAFVEKYLSNMVGQAADPIRVITTSQPNSVYVDYRGGSEGRILVTVHDAIHPEWSIQARYEPAGGEWQKTQGNSLSDPEPKNIYEWEKDVNQWILKSSAN